jgi:hypothetical protein
MVIAKYLVSFVIFMFASYLGIIDFLWRGGPLSIPEATVAVAFGARLLSELFL